MKLTKLKMHNFRAYKDETIIDLDEGLTAFIGKNDVGKSTVLEALEIFFNNSIVKIENGDHCVKNPEDAHIQIACCFSHIPERIAIDDTNETNLADELLLNSDGELEVVKAYKKAAKSPNEEILLRANFPVAETYQGILDKTKGDLKKLAQEIGVWDNVGDQRKNADIRRSIRESYGEIELAPQLIALKKGDGKAIWDKLNKAFPIYALFKSDRGSNDQDREVQDPMKLAVDVALKEVQVQLDQIKEQVQSQALDVAKRTLEKLKEMDRELAEDLQPTFKEEPKWSGIFKLNLNSEENIPVNKRGSGVRRLILLNFFRAEAERLKTEKNTTAVIYALEEPETSQHPSNQQMIINALLELASSSGSQVLLTTHVPALAELLPLNSLRFVHRTQEDIQPRVATPSKETYSKIAETLGILPEPESGEAGAIVIVEGHSDVHFIRHTAQCLKKAGHIPYSLDEKNIILLMTGGCGNLKHWINLRLLEKLGKPHIAFMDSDKTREEDPPGGIQNQKNIQEVQNKGVKIIFTRKREAENYLCPSLLEGVAAIGDYDDVKGLAKDKGILAKKWPLMNAQMILDRDQYSDHGETKHELKEAVLEMLNLVH